MDISAVRQGLADNAATIAGLATYGYVPDSIIAPTFFAGEVDITYDAAYARGMDDIRVTCKILAAPATEVQTGQQRLDGYLKGAGPTSLKAAIESDDTLGGACDDLRVERVQGYRLYELGGVTYIGAELIVRVIGSGT